MILVCVRGGQAEVEATLHFVGWQLGRGTGGGREENTLSGLVA